MLSEEIISRMEICELEQLKIHEQTVEQNLTSLRETMLNLGKLVDPLIVDKEHKIVLDGNHRRNVLELLKADHAVCQMVDYKDPEIKIGGWHFASNKLDFDKLEGEDVDLQGGQKALQDLKATFMALKKTNGGLKAKLIPSTEHTLGSIITDQGEFFKSQFGMDPITQNGSNGDVFFIEDTRKDIYLNNNYTVLARKIFSKEEVVKEASAGRPLPPKSTRHIIPGRVIRLNFRLGYLNEPKESAYMLLREMVKKRVKFGSARYYTEPVVVLY